MGFRHGAECSFGMGVPELRGEFIQFRVLTKFPGVCFKVSCMPAAPHPAET